MKGIKKYYINFTTDPFQVLLLHRAFDNRSTLMLHYARSNLGQILVITKANNVNKYGICYQSYIREKNKNNKSGFRMF